MIIDVYSHGPVELWSSTVEDSNPVLYRCIPLVLQLLLPLPLFRLIPPLRLGIGLLDLFTLEVNVGEGVSCLGQQAPMYLLLNYIIISIVVVLIDSSIFLFLRLSPENFALPAAGVLPRCGVPRKAALLAEEAFIQAAFFGAGRNMKTILQLVMAKMLWSEFLPMWDDYTQACEDKYKGSESIAVYGTSVCFWLLVIPTLHLVLNTAACGVASKKIDKKYDST